MKTIILGLGMVLCMLTFTGCRKQEERVLGGWTGEDEEGVTMILKIKKDGYTMFKNNQEVNFCLTRIEDGYLVCEKNSYNIVKTPYAVRKGSLYIYGYKFERN